MHKLMSHLSHTVVWPHGSALSDEDKLIGASSCPSLNFLTLARSSVLFPLDLSSCGQGEDFGDDEEIPEGGNLGGNLFLQPQSFPQT